MTRDQLEPRGELQIPYGLNSYDNPVYVEDASKDRTYVCPECREKLDVRRGDFLEYFAHAKNNPNAQACVLFTKAGIEKMREAVRESSAEARERTRSMELVIRKHPYVDRLDLFAKVPACTWDEWLETGADEWQISGSGLQGLPSKANFHPSRGPVEIAVLPKAGAIELRMAGAPARLDGMWSASFARPYPSFVGSQETAFQRQSLAKLAEGDSVFLADRPGMVLKDGKQVSIAGVRYQQFEVSGFTIERLRDLDSSASIDLGAFRAVVVCPHWQHPDDLDRIIAPPNSEVVVAIQFPTGPNLAPKLEVIELPKQEEPPMVISGDGSGRPFYFRFKLAEQQTRRFTLFWAGRHKDVRASAAEERSVDAVFPGIDLSLHCDDGARTVLRPSLGAAEVELAVGAQARKTGGAWHLEGPIGLDFTMESRQEADGARRIWVRSYHFLSEKSDRALQGAFAQGADMLRLDFGILGAIRVIIKPSAGRIEQPWVDERIRAVRLPEKGCSWAYIRLVIDLPAGTNHKGFGGLKKMVRRAVARVETETTKGRGHDD